MPFLGDDWQPCGRYRPVTEVPTAQVAVLIVQPCKGSRGNWARREGGGLCIFLFGGM